MRLALAGKPCCDTKKPQVEQVEVVGAPLPSAPRDAWAQESESEKKVQGTRRAEM